MTHNTTHCFVPKSLAFLTQLIIQRRKAQQQMPERCLHLLNMPWDDKEVLLKMCVYSSLKDHPAVGIRSDILGPLAAEANWPDHSV